MPVIGASIDNGKTFGNIIVLAVYNNYVLRLVGKYVFMSRDYVCSGLIKYKIPAKLVWLYA